MSAAVFFWIFTFASFAVEWTQYQGPNHDGVSMDKILTNWSDVGPRQLWKTPLLDGFSSFTVSQGKAYTLVRRTVSGSSKEVCIALNADTGQELWAKPVGAATYTSGADAGYGDNVGGDGPRSTPTVDGTNVYVLSAYLGLYCFGANTGNLVWSRNLTSDFKSTVIEWQNGASPLIDGDLLFVNCNAANQCLLALDKKDGHVVWSGQNDKMTQSTPVAATILGQRQIIFYAQSGLVSVVPETGAVLWRFKISYNTSVAASPAVIGDIVYISANYGIGDYAIKISSVGGAFSATQLWHKYNYNHWATSIPCNGYIYGLFGSAYYGGCPLKCINLADGKVMWSVSNFGMGGLLLVDGHLLVLTDDGQMVLVDPNPTAYTEIARYQALAGKCWNCPSVSNGRIYARSTKEGVCLDTAVALPPPPALTGLALRNSASGHFQLGLTNSTGGDITPSRVPNIKVIATTNLNLPLVEWMLLPDTLDLRNGALWWEDSQSGTMPQRFFKTIETP